MTRDNIQSYQDEYSLWREERKELDRLLSAEQLTPEEVRALQGLCKVYDKAMQAVRESFVNEMLDEINAETEARINECIPQN